MMPTAVLFDLDGTLADPQPGIGRCIRHALAALGHPAPADRDLEGWIGPPLRESFAGLLGSRDPALLDRALALYRERFGTLGLFENTLYPAAPESLAAVRALGCRTFLATSKPRVFAARIVAHFGLAPMFDGVHGSELDGRRSAKAELIAHVLAAHHLPPGRVVMVGDRRHDADGARACGVACLGVTWGYGTADELRQHGVTVLAHHPREIPGLLGRALAAGREPAAPAP
jgi:phosphoglycolate phosphatase